MSCSPHTFLYSMPLYILLLSLSFLGIYYFLLICLLLLSLTLCTYICLLREPEEGRRVLCLTTLSCRKTFCLHCHYFPAILGCQRSSLLSLLLPLLSFTALFCSERHLFLSLMMKASERRRISSVMKKHEENIFCSSLTLFCRPFAFLSGSWRGLRRKNVTVAGRTPHLLCLLSYLSHRLLHLCAHLEVMMEKD